MAQKYRIYINQKVLLITENAPANAESYKMVEQQGFDFKKFYAEVNRKKKAATYLMVCTDAKKQLKKVIKQVALVEAAGGLVEQKNGELLFIYRHDKWDLPKGKLEKGEKPKAGAVREVEEECGITIKKCGKRICKTYHAYVMKDELVLKRTYWYDMSYKGKGELKPQLEEGITDVRWFNAADIPAVVVNNTFPSIMDVLVKKKLIEG
ncbi:NUDIX domain-containing protein [Mucilaginibacter koreensis]